MACPPSAPPPLAELLGAALLLLLSLPLSLPLSVSYDGCVFAADLSSCTNQSLDGVPWTPPASTVHLDLSHNLLTRLEAGDLAGLRRLETLRLSHNRIAAIQPGAFSNASGSLLRHLDLSSNRLQALERHFFEELPGLEELLLFDNRIAAVDQKALEGLGNLRKAYLSHNRLTDFPFFTLSRDSHPHLALLDLSSNRLPHLPVDDVIGLPSALQRGLYLHNNSLLCDCPMYHLFRYWEQRRFDSVSLFRTDFVCLLYGMPRVAVRFLLHRRYFNRCNLSGAALKEQDESVVVQEGAWLILHCITPLTGRSVSFCWRTPGGEYVEPPGNNGSLRMFANGSLTVAAVREQDAGTYTCVALDRLRGRNETWEVNVTLALERGGDGETFNTGYTTLLGCVVSLVLVLMYLYLTPCRCPPQRHCRRMPKVATLSLIHI